MRDFHSPGRSGVYAQNGMVATSHPLATKVALDMLQRGGNAADAAVAAALMLPLCEPSATVLFGDAFALIKPAGDEHIIGINGSGPAPAALSAEAMRAEGLTAVPTKDACAVTLPGAVAAFERILQEQGLMGWADVAAPAIHY
ncbi:MAG: gamma-glutamyltransferase, partial [Thiohalocapsa sp.]